MLHKFTLVTLAAITALSICLLVAAPRAEAGTTSVEIECQEPDSRDEDRRPDADGGVTIFCPDPCPESEPQDGQQPVPSKDDDGTVVVIACPSSCPESEPQEPRDGGAVVVTGGCGGGWVDPTADIHNLAATPGESVTPIIVQLQLAFG